MKKREIEELRRLLEVEEAFGVDFVIRGKKPAVVSATPRTLAPAPKAPKAVAPPVTVPGQAKPDAPGEAAPSSPPRSRKEEIVVAAAPVEIGRDRAVLFEPSSTESLISQKPANPA